MKTIRKIVAFILTATVLSSMCISYTLATDRKYDETEYLKQFICEEFIVEDKAIQDYEQAWITGEWTEFNKYLAGYHPYQNSLMLYFEPVNPDPFFFRKVSSR